MIGHNVLWFYICSALIVLEQFDGLCVVFVSVSLDSIRSYIEVLGV